MKDKMLIIAAMPEEVQHLRAILHQYSSRYAKFDNGRFHSYLTDEGKQIDILICGVGMINSILSLHNLFYKRISDLRDRTINYYDSIINIGSVGSRGELYQVGDIVPVSKVYDGDFDLTAFGYPKYSIPGIGDCLELSKNDTFVETPCITVSRFLSDSSFIEGFDNYIVDMELYGIASIIKTFNILDIFSSYKVVTDTTDGIEAKNSHVSNLETLCSKLCDYIYNHFIA